MIRHVVMFKLKERTQPQRAELRSRLESMQGRIAALSSLSVGVDQKDSPRSWDVCLQTQFATWDDLAAYAQHPLHQEVLAWIDVHVEQVAVVDWQE